MTEYFPITSLLAVKLTTEMVIVVGMAAVTLISMFTFLNWRAGVKIACVMVLLEGAVRKWVPGMSELAYFVKDIFLVGAYMRFYFSPTPEIRSWSIRAPMGAITMMSVIVSLSALNPNIGSPILSLYGLKIYFFYIPLIFMVPYLFRTRHEMENNLFWYAMAGLPVCLIGVAQYALPTDSFLNMNTTGGAATHMGWEGSRTRVMGTFSYITGHVTFVSVFFALNLALLLNKLPKWRKLALLANLPLLAANGLMAGSRSAIFSMGLIALIFTVYSTFTRVGNAGNAILLIGAVAVIIAGVLSLFFGEAQQQFMARYNAAGDSVQYRMVGMASKSVGYAMVLGGGFGYGMGMTHPALEQMRQKLKIARPKKVPPVFDIETGQVLAELGVVGAFCWYGIRLLFLYITIQGLRQTEPGALKALLLASVCIQLPHFVMSMVLNHTANFLVCFFAGFGMLPYLVPTVQRRFVGGRQLRNVSAPATLPAPLPANVSTGRAPSRRRYT